MKYFEALITDLFYFLFLDDLDEVQEIAAVFSDDYDDVVNPGPCIRPVPPHKPLSYQTSNTNSLESYTNDSARAEHGLISPSVAELKNSLALPLKKVFEKSCTLDNRNMKTIQEHQNQAVKSIRPRAQTSNSFVGGNRTSREARTPTGKSEPESTLSSPGSNGSPCKNPVAYVVTEIVDANDTKKRPSVRLRESRPKKNLSKTIQKQLDEPEPFYFGLEHSPVCEEESVQDKEPVAPSHVKKRDANKGWRQVLPIVTDKNKVFSSCDENENTCAVSPDKDGPSFGNTSEKDIKYKHKVAMKPPPTRKGRPVLEKSCSVGMQSSGIWSPRTLERHRMLLDGPSNTSQQDLGRIRAGSLRQQLPSPYELVESPSTLSSTTSVACAEGVGCYSKMVRPYDGRRRASSTGSSDFPGRQSDKSYNQLMIGV